MFNPLRYGVIFNSCLSLQQKPALAHFGQSGHTGQVILEALDASTASKVPKN
ncbi:MAG: hypothetical protein SGJ20_20140 [Planctomycetota bacterium]|nr:hypothetical protein [Planctomycetota bacterium]